MQKNINKFIKEQRGITLVALIITIIVMLILASATVVIVVGDNSLVAKSKHAKFVTEVKDLQERVRAKMAQLGTFEYMGTINQLLGTNTKLNDKFTVQDGELVYIGDKVTSRERTWLAELGIEEAGI